MENIINDLQLELNSAIENNDKEAAYQLESMIDDLINEMDMD